MTTARKAFVLGVDGATFEVLEPLLAKGELPHFARLRDRGVHGTLDSTIPPLSPPAWISSITGCDPSRHGVYHFHTSRGYPTGGHDVTLLTMKSVRVPTMWNWISAQGKHGLCVNVPLTYPPQSLNNVVMLSGFPTPPSADDACAPRDVGDELADVGLPYEANEPPLRDFRSDEFRTRGLEAHFRAEEDKVRGTLHLMKTRPWDVGMHVMTMTDRFQHFFWGDDELLGRVYREIDRLIGLLLDAIGDDTNIFLMSDHGFGPYRGDFNTSAFLRQKGYLRLRETGRVGGYGMRVARPELSRLLQKVRLGAVSRRLPSSLQSKRVAIPRPYWKGWKLVDWSTSRAYCSDFGVRINLKGRQPRGIVEPGAEYEALRTELMDELRALRHPETGTPLISALWRREEIHTGPLAHLAPDILFEVQGMEYVQSDRLGPMELLTPVRFTGTHRIPGVIYAAGPDVPADGRFDGARIIDLAPTVLHAAGLPVPEGLDGRVLDECFASGTKAPRYAAPLAAEDEASGGDIASRDQAALERRLRQLGYL